MVCVFFWNRQQTNLQNHYFVALSRSKSLETKFGNDENLKERYSDTFEKDLKKRYVSKLGTSKNDSETLCWYVPHHPVLNPNKPQKVRNVCNAASEFRGISLNCVLLIGSDLLRSL